MSASDVMKAAKTAQVRESIDRGGRSPDAQQNRELNEAAMDVVDDTNVPIDEPGQPQQVNQQIEPEAKPINEPRRSPFEQRRADIIARFREKRAEDSEDSDENTRDIRRLTRDGMPPELVPIADVEDEPEPAPVVEAGETKDEQVADEAQPAKRKIKVRGKEIEVTDDELLAFAQKGAAGDDYLSEARKTLDEVKALREQTRAPGQAQPAGTHPAGFIDPTQSNVADQQLEAGSEHHTDPFFDAAETMQLGTPEEAATKMRRSVEDTAAQAARKVLESERLRDEVARSHRYLKDFQDANKDLAGDTLAQAVIERKLYDLQVEDIKALGIDDAQLPKTPTDIANWHLYYRANGYKTRNIPELLTTARDEVNKWRGVAPKPTPTEPAARKAEPRVEVTVDRTQRRAAIPQQPSRTAAPKPAAQAAPAPQRDRSSVVQDMIAARAKPRGKTMGV